MELLLPLLILVVIALAIASRSIRIVPQATAMVIERLGRF